MNVLLLSNQLIDPEIIKKALKVDKINITIYESETFYVINKVPVSETKRKYFKHALLEYTMYHKAKVVKTIEQLKSTTYHHFEFLDIEIEDRLKEAKISLVEHPNPMFLLTRQHRESWIKTHKSFTFNVFYKYHRVLLDIFPKPIGGKWTYDEDNQQKVPMAVYNKLAIIDEIKFPTNRLDAQKHLRDFVKHKLDMFGPYQDAIVDKNIILWHSGLSPMLNLGLLLPREVVKLIPDKWPKAQISSYEGFLRQLFWREYMALVYRAEIPIKNIFRSQKNLNSSWYKIDDKPIIGIKLIDQKIKQAIRIGYLNHIERLMLVGNIMLLMQFKPDTVYTWFMCNFIDAHHWVMVGNVYHMLLFASGRCITQRPYIASTTYLRKQLTPGLTEDEYALYDKYYMNFVLKNINIIKHTYMSSGHIKRAKMLKQTIK